MDLLRAAGGRLCVGHSELNLRNPSGLTFPDAIVTSSAIPPDNVEILYAKSAGIQARHLAGKLTEDYNLIAVSGSHVSAVLQAAWQKFPFKEILVISQPHTYSRLAVLKNEYTTAFFDAIKTFAARETNHWNVTGRDLAVSIKGPSSEFIPSLTDVINKLLVQISKDPNREIVILTLGAGDITILSRKLFHQ